MSNTIILETNFELQFLEKVNILNSRQMVEKLLEQGYQYFILVDPHIEQFSGKIVLPIENDIEFLLESYLYLEELILQQETFEHNTYLGDGVLEIKAKVSATSVDILYNYCPQLNVANLVNYKTKTTKENFLTWWRNLACKLVKIQENYNY